MASCQDMDRLLTPYLDDEAGGGDREAVASHLQGCRRCALRAAAESAARQVLRLRATMLTARAPAALRARCERLGAASAARPAAVWLTWRLAGVAAAAGLVLVVGATLVYGIVSHSPTVLVLGLTLDHVKCFALAGEEAEADSRTVAARLEADYGWHLSVPESLPREQLRLLGARRCFSTDGAAAHVLYRHAGRPVSLFVIPQAGRGAMRVALAGHRAHIWSRDGKTYVLLARESDVELRPVARHFGGGEF